MYVQTSLWTSEGEDSFGAASEWDLLDVGTIAYKQEHFDAFNALFKYDPPQDPVDDEKDEAHSAAIDMDAEDGAHSAAPPMDEEERVHPAATPIAANSPCPSAMRARSAPGAKGGGKKRSTGRGRTTVGFSRASAELEAAVLAELEAAALESKELSEEEKKFVRRRVQNRLAQRRFRLKAIKAKLAVAADLAEAAKLTAAPFLPERELPKIKRGSNTGRGAASAAHPRNVPRGPGGPGP